MAQGPRRTEDPRDSLINRTSELSVELMLRPDRTKRNLADMIGLDAGLLID